MITPTELFTAFRNSDRDPIRWGRHVVGELFARNKVIYGFGYLSKQLPADTDGLYAAFLCECASDDTLLMFARALNRYAWARSVARNRKFNRRNWIFGRKL